MSKGLQHSKTVDASPQPQRRLNNNNNKASRNNQQVAQHAMGTVSDSNLPGNTTPKSKRQQRGKQQGERASSMAVPNSRSGPELAQSQRARPASIAVQNPPLAATPQKAAYAGPTFHASPAPSSLPVPKFFSKSVPAAGPEAGFQARMDKETDNADSASESDNNRLAPPSRNTQQSPLDMFFRADREERAKRQSSSGLDIPPQNISSIRSETPERPRPGPSHSNKGLFMMELDESDSPVAKRGTGFAPSRMTAERSRSSPTSVPTLGDEEAQRAAYTKSLKDLLNLQPSEDSPDSTQSPVQASKYQDPESPFGSRVTDRGTTTPSTPQKNGQTQSSHNFLYGNRNLSPMFQAARQDSPTRPSNLRQQFHPHEQVPSPSQQYSNQPSSTMPYMQHLSGGNPAQVSPSRSPYQSYTQPYQYQQQPQASFEGFERPPQYPQHDQPQPQQQQQHYHHNQQPPPVSQNVKSMEDDLRRILKLDMS